MPRTVALLDRFVLISIGNQMFYILIRSITSKTKINSFSHTWCTKKHTRTLAFFLLLYVVCSEKFSYENITSAIWTRVKDVSTRNVNCKIGRKSGQFFELKSTYIRLIN